MTVTLDDLTPCQRGHRRRRGRIVYCPTCRSEFAKAAGNWKHSSPWATREHVAASGRGITMLAVAMLQQWVVSTIGYRPVLILEPTPAGKNRALLQFTDGTVHYRAEVSRLYDLRKRNPRASSERLFSVFSARRNSVA